jgi:hypothetical protein
MIWLRRDSHTLCTSSVRRTKLLTRPNITQWHVFQLNLSRTLHWGQREGKQHLCVPGENSRLAQRVFSGSTRKTISCKTVIYQCAKCDKIRLKWSSVNSDMALSLCFDVQWLIILARPTRWGSRNATIWPLCGQIRSVVEYYRGKNFP